MGVVALGFSNLASAAVGPVMRWFLTRMLRTTK